MTTPRQANAETNVSRSSSGGSAGKSDPFAFEGLSTVPKRSRPMRAAPGPAAANSSAPGSWESPQRGALARAPASPISVSPTAALAQPSPARSAHSGFAELLLAGVPFASSRGGRGEGARPSSVAAERRDSAAAPEGDLLGDFSGTLGVVVAAAKDAQSSLQSRLGDLDVFAPKGARPRPPAGGGAVPAFFYEWAAQLSALPADRRAAALGAMPEDDRLTLQRILDQEAVVPSAGGAMIDFGGEGGAPPEGDGTHAALYANDEAAADGEGSGPGQGDEPELRRALRARRRAEMHERMRAGLAEKTARDAAEAGAAEARAAAKDAVAARMAAWQAGRAGNIRALLSMLHTVLWPDSGWKPPGLTDLLEPARVKRAYMRANLVVHPDKVKQRGGGPEQTVVADIAFDALKIAWAKFEAGELRGGNAASQAVHM
ncbi:hypothetical protein WJX81_005559 [Elliptochloris bilobata]|uniref:J domain-containing protein n=1 Tax=Elliptochloris bilobata TaxID=381761 RepID=A0AAW1S6P7_9CHLO